MTIPLQEAPPNRDFLWYKCRQAPPVGCDEEEAHFRAHGFWWRVFRPQNDISPGHFKVIVTDTWDHSSDITLGVFTDRQEAITFARHERAKRGSNTFDWIRVFDDSGQVVDDEKP